VRRELSRFGVASDIAGVIDRWPDAVGPAISRNAWPARIGRDGTLHVNVADSVWAFELGHQAAEIAQRLEVAAVKFVPGPLPEQTPPTPLREVPKPSPEDERRAAEIAAAIDDEELRESVQKAVVLSLLRAPDDSPF
jgi:hypothetical protein